MARLLKDEVIATRKTEYPIHPLLQSRCSPRSMNGDEITFPELMALFEAARWTPSSFNGQPWRFIYAQKKTPHWLKFFDLLVDSNKQWVEKASVLVLVISYNLFSHNHKTARTHSFDTGAAWMALTLEATYRDLVAHAMEGFDYTKAKEVFSIPDDYTVEAMIAVGKPAPIAALPVDLQKKEIPSTRRPLSEIVREGTFF